MNKRILGLYISGIVLILLNHFIVHRVLIGSAGFLLSFLPPAMLLGKKWLPRGNEAQALAVGSLLTASVIIIPLTSIFYSASLPAVSYLIAYILATGLIVISHAKKVPIASNFRLAKPTPEQFILGALYLLFLGLAFLTLFKARTDAIIFSPWEVVPAHFFTLVFFATITLFALSKKVTSQWSPLLASPLIFLLLTAGSIVYKLGYGFDPFIHRATEHLLLESGTISPKPFYYIGHYVSVLTLSKLTGASIEIVDTLLPPMAFALILPILITTFTVRKINPIASLLLLTLPFPLLVNPTPQAFALVFALSGVILAALASTRAVSLAVLFPLILTTFFIHPLAAIPAIIATVAVITQQLFKKHQKIALIIIAAGGALLYPAMIILGGSLTALRAYASISFDSLYSLIYSPYNLHYNFPLDLAYLVGNISFIIILILAIKLWFKSDKNKRQFINPISLTGIATLVGGMIIAISVNYSGLAGMESSDFARRVLMIGFIITALSIIPFLTDELIASKVSKVFLTLSAAVFMLSALYLSYPRFDDYQNSKQLNVSKYDFLAVDYIEERENTKTYAVLANQMTSVAALSKFGFNRNINTLSGENIYFYPIPTSGKFYSYYEPILKSNDPAPLINEVKAYLKVEDLYLILNPRWSNYTAIDARLKGFAKEFTKSEGNFSIFRF